MRKPFLKPDNPQLRKVSEEIPQDQINSPETRKIIKTMLKIAYGEQKDQNKPIMVGLAAPQIGISKRIILVDVKADGKGPLRPRPALPRGESEASRVRDLHIYINPQITWISKREGEWYEGCYSTGRVCGVVSRPVSIKIQAFTNEGKLVEEKHTGYIARIFQHEIDHLNGKLFTDHIKNPDHLHWVEEHEFPLYRNEQAWRNWPKKYQKPLGTIS